MSLQLSQDSARTTTLPVPVGDVRRAFRNLLPALGILLLVAVASIAFRTIAFRGYSGLPTGFDGPMVFRQRYLIAHGWFLDHAVSTYSYWSAVVNAQLGSFLMELINAVMLWLNQLTGIPTRLLHQLVLTPVLIGVATALLVQQRATKPHLSEFAAVAALATLGTPVVINFLNGWNVAYAWCILLLFTLIYISKLPVSVRLLLTLGLTFIGPPLYHTFGFLLTTYALTLWGFSALIGLRRVTGSPLTIIVYFLTYQTYVSVLFFGALLKGLSDVVSLNFLKRDAPVIAVTPINTGLINLQYLHLALYAMLAIPVGIAVLRFAKLLLARRRGIEPADDPRMLAAISALALAIGVFAVLFGLKFSPEFMINRGASYLIIPALLAMINELRCRRRAYRYVYLITLLAVSASLYSFAIQAATSHAATNLTHAEEEGYTWLRERMRPEDVIFTDFRLSGPPIADGHFRVVGITGEGDEQTNKLLDTIYYQSNAATITSAIDQLRTEHEGHPADYLFLSVLMEHDYPGLNGYSSRFAPAPASFFSALDNSSDWRLVFQNEDTRIYQRRGGS